MQLIGHLIGCDASGNLGITDSVKLLSIHLLNEIKRLTLQASVHTAWIADVENGVALVAEANATVGRGQKAARPVGSATTDAGAGGHHHEGWQVGGLCTQAIKRPGTQTGAAWLCEACVEKELGWRVIELIGAGRFDQADVIGDRTEVWQDL